MKHMGLIPKGDAVTTGGFIMEEIKKKIQKIYDLYNAGAISYDAALRKIMKLCHSSLLERFRALLLREGRL